MRTPRPTRNSALLPVGGSLLAHGLAAVVLGVGSWWLTKAEEPIAPPEFDVEARKARPDVDPVAQTHFEVTPPEELNPPVVEQDWQAPEELLPEAEVEMLLPHPRMPIDWDAAARDPARVAPSPPAEPVVETPPAVEPSDPTAVVEAPQVDSLACPPPRYPRAARRQRLQGLVEILVKIDAAGQVLEISIHESSGHSLLDNAAVDAVRNWGFHPARDGEGRPAEGELVVPVRFRLNPNN